MNSENLKKYTHLTNVFLIQIYIKATSVLAGWTQRCSRTERNSVPRLNKSTMAHVSVLSASAFNGLPSLWQNPAPHEYTNIY